MKIIVLAAGKSKRFKSNKHKALHNLLGKTILERVLGCLHELSSSGIQLVLGHQMEEIKEYLKGGEDFVEQKEQLGTGHALQTGLMPIEDSYKGGLLVTCVDTPLLRSSTLKSLIQAVHSSKAQVGVLTTQLANPFGYGRIIKQEGLVKAIVEEKDASHTEREIKEINAGVYFFDLSLGEVKKGLSSLGNNNEQKEYYLTDLIAWANQQNYKAISYCTNDSTEILGINSRADLAQAIEASSQRKITELQAEGVTFIKPETSLIAPEIFIGSDTIILPGCYLLGQTSIGEESQIGPNTYIENSEIGKNTNIRFSQVISSSVGSYCSVGPYANLRPGSKIMDYAGIGDFVEVKNSEIGSRSKVSHLSYIGDSVIGEEVNVGAGTITANFDSISGQKNKTELGNQVKVGSNSVLVAPIKIADGCMIAAGSVVTENVESKESLIISRNPQTVKEGWVSCKKQKQS